MDQNLGGDEKAQIIADSTKKPNFVIFALGQGGSNIGKVLKSTLSVSDEDFISINMSEYDLAESGAKHKIKFGRTEGAGKNRDLSKQEFKNSNVFDQVIDQYKDKIYGPNKIILTTFSTGGGTGSGSGPLFTLKLTQHVLNNKDCDLIDKPQILGLAILPVLKGSIDSGTKSYQNSLECLQEIAMLIDKKLASFSLIENDIANSELKNITEIYSFVNQKVAKTIKRFYCEIGKSDNNADLRDRIVALEHPGFVGFYSNNEPTQFIIPQQSDSAKLMIAEIPTGDEALENFRKFLRANSISSSEEIISPVNCDSSIIGLFGITAIAKIVEPIRVKLEEGIVRDAKRTKQVKSESTGFDGLSYTRDMIDKTCTKATLSEDEINNLL